MTPEQRLRVDDELLTSDSLEQEALRQEAMAEAKASATWTPRSRRETPWEKAGQAFPGVCPAGRAGSSKRCDGRHASPQCCPAVHTRTATAGRPQTGQTMYS